MIKSLEPKFNRPVRQKAHVRSLEGVSMFKHLLMAFTVISLAGCTADVTLVVPDTTPGHRYVVAFGDGTGGVFTEVTGSHYEIPWSTPVEPNDLKTFDLEKDGIAVYPGTIPDWNVNVQVNTQWQSNGPWACDYYGSYGFINNGVQIVCPEGGNPIP